MPAPRSWKKSRRASRRWVRLGVALALFLTLALTGQSVAQAAPLPANGASYVTDTGQRYVFNVGLSECATIGQGVQGSCVASAQLMLNAFIDAGLGVDGQYGTNTAAAVRTYEQRRGLSPTGVIDDAVRAAFAQDYGIAQGTLFADIPPDTGMGAGNVVVFPNPGGGLVPPVDLGCIPNTSNYFGTFAPFNCVASYKDNYNRGSNGPETFWIRQGNATQFGLAKAETKHGLNLNSIATTIVNGSRENDPYSTRVVFRLGHHNPATGQIDVVIRVIADQAPSYDSPDGYNLGLLTAYCEDTRAQRGQCPPGVNALVAANI